MLKIKDVINALEQYAPLENQAEYDNCGLLYGDLDWEFKGALVALDTSVEVVNEAIEKGVNLIIEHHPSIFMPIKKISLAIPKHRAIALAIKNDIAIYSAHTSVDFTEGGLNDKVMELIGCDDYATLTGRASDMRIGLLKEVKTLGDLAETIKNTFNDTHVVTIGDIYKNISKIAVVNGGGGGSEREVMEAINAGADVYISGDFKYNVMRLAKDIGF
ncbi:MAG: Nif3-like dinuclear metal center hexameric protein, partial [Clostridia bacterium]|nr:Nif3-like dinuclear metal center hexameric protein [Clostridia bacterium]